ncbi:hypothetical protein TRIP_B320016 [uncultured Desulfatiglans sp.]|uniref:Uncharacterized protein n=1 Tax=Uncultured Desulfatiglans sp. TaxID=1748965 RepID=A0A653A760_UNCDX|nr:hypothetical protein TRIP_B320016 [uncultured Desulfatiglans sp.]
MCESGFSGRIRRRFVSIEVFAETADRRREDSCAQKRQGGELGPKRLEAGPLEEDAADDDQEIPERVEVGEPLHGQGHVGDGEDEPAQHEERDHEEEGGHHGLLLSGGDGGDEEPDPECAQEKEAGGAEEQGRAPDHGDLEPPDGEDRDPQHLGLGDQDVGDGLAEDPLGGGQRGDDQLLHRAGLPLADDGHRGEKQGQEHDQKGHDAGHIEVLAVEVRVVPGADAPVDPAVFEVLGVELPDEAVVQPLEGGEGVGDAHRGHVAHAAVDEDLHIGRPARAERRAEIRRDDHRHVDAPFEQGLLKSPGVLREEEDAEGLVGIVGILQHAAFDGAALVDQGEADIPDVRADDVAEEDQLHEGRDDQQRPVLAVPKQLDEFLPDEFPDPQSLHVQSPSRLSARSVPIPSAANIPSSTA